MLNSLLPLKYRPQTPGSRWRTKKNVLASASKIEKDLTFTRRWHAGRTFNGRVCRRGYKSKKYHSRCVQKVTVLVKPRSLFVKSFSFQFPKNKLCVLCQQDNGGLFYLPATESMAPGRIIYPYSDLLQFTDMNTLTCSFAGLPINVSMVFDYKKISNIVLWPFIKYKYATSSGTFALKLRAPKREKKIRIQLPSGVVYSIPRSSLGIVGRSYQQWTNKQNLGKAGTQRRNGYGPLVRGIAMNPVDHPHGGKTNSAQPERSPWGWVTKACH